MVRPARRTCHAANARADGNISMFEQRDINNARRDVNIADKQVAVDTQRRHVGHLERQFSDDGKITMGERFRLNQERGKLNSMTAQPCSRQSICAWV
jgi:hypothetical protein